MNKTKNLFPHPDSFSPKGGTIEGLFDIDADIQDDDVVYQDDYDKLMKAYRALYKHTTPPDFKDLPDHIELVDRVKKICGTCGSDDVKGDAYAIWDVTSQEWEVAGGDIMSGGHVCEECEGECDIESVPVDFILKAICGICGIYEDDGETGFCKNGHDNWVELRDFSDMDLQKGYVPDAASRFGLKSYQLKDAILKGETLTPIKTK